MSTPQQSTAQLPAVSMGFSSIQSFEFLQRTARMFAASNMVPATYQEWVTKGYGDKAQEVQNPAAMANCMIALDMSQRMNANPLMIMQNLHVIEGRPSWSSQFIIAAINNSGKFSPLRFDLQWLDEIDAAYSTFEWENRQKVEKKHLVRVKNARCVAWAVEKGIRIPDFGLEDLKANGGVYGCCKAYGIPLLESAPVTMEMAVAEGWFGKNGSKWKSMPDLMMRYRSAAFFGRIYAPELLMGLPSAEEIADIVTVGGDGGFEVTRGTVPNVSGVVGASGEVEPGKTEPGRQPLADYPADRFAEKLPEWRELVQSGKKTTSQILNTLKTRNTLSDEQVRKIEKLGASDAKTEAPAEQTTTANPADPMAEHADFLADMGQ